MLLNNSSLKKNLIFGALLAASAALVIAGDGGQEFEAVYEMIEGWATGTLGKIIALAALIVGIGFGLVRQSVIAAVIGISMALVLNFGPSVISNILTARECQDFCVWGGYSRGSPTRLPFVFEMQYARPDAIAGAKVEGPARSAGGSSLAPAIARREAAGALAREV